MKKLCSTLAVLVLLPLAAMGNVGPATTATVMPEDSVRIGDGQTAGYDCCWVFVLGRWHCIPC